MSSHEPTTGRSALTKAGRSAAERGSPRRGEARTRRRPKAGASRREPPAASRSESTRDGEVGLPYLINLIANYVNESMREDLTRAGMTVPRWTVLAALRDEDGQAIGDLSRHCLIRQSSLTRVVDQLERDGHVRRRHSRHDQRVVQVWLTPAGRALYEQTVPDIVERASAALRQLVASEMDQLNRVLEHARDSLRNNDAKALPAKNRSSRSAPGGRKKTGRKD